MTPDGGSDKRVRHQSYGEGTVTAVERGGMALRVRFDRYPGLEVSLPARLLRLVGADEGATGGAKRKPRAKARATSTIAAKPVRLSPEDAVRRQVLEAVRLGVVPLRGLLAYTVGRDEEIESARSMLEGRDGDRCRAVLGDYGTGKTHLLELIQHIALDLGWVVGRAWLDPQEAPPSKPRRVYAALARSFVYPDKHEAGELGLWPLLEQAARDDELQNGLFDSEHRHAFLAPAIRYARGLLDELEQHPESSELSELQILLTDWIEGRATGVSQELQRRLHANVAVRDRVLALSDFGTLPRIYGYMLSGVGHLARRCGYRGVLLLLDETELFSNLDLEARARAVDVFRVLMSAALPDEAMDLTSVRKGGRGIIRELPPRFGSEGNLALALAATPGSASEDFLRETLGPERVLELRRFGKAQFREMGDRILDLYLQAYPAVNRRVLAALEAKADQWIATGALSSPREFGRRTLDFLDQTRHAAADFAPGRA
ncbi:MAG: DUF2791 family P-loop domain-containing protein [Planctomycetes bacterium]|nr:DUF2791 family P-loop domain-containing protein [Planctomycetota bacterium]MCB9890664.1 DUF2791 family P-loop domain-containing protein [Planctomycetota bacterium]MCB9920113.1 DUF2791 family P-loop domain-containing protein [Planctomycetota bacterium]